MIEFTAWPEMLAWPYLMLQGWLPYRDIAIAHTPLLLMVLTAFYKIFGVGIVQLKVFTWCLIAINLSLTFWVATKSFSKKVAVLASIIYLPLCLYYSGNGLWFDLALVPFALLLYYFLKEKKYLYSGIIFALGVLTKQTFVYFTLPVVVGFFVKDLKDRIEMGKSMAVRFGQFAIGSVAVVTVFLIVMLLFGILDDFYFWAIRFGTLYLPKASGQINLPTLKQFLVNIFPFSVVILNPSFIIWIIAGIVGVYPRWELFHFQPALPFLAITISNLIYSKKYRYIVVIYLLVVALIAGRGIYKSFGKETRFFESDVQKVSDELEIGGAKTLYTTNYWDNLYSLTNTTPATKPLIPYIPWYLELGGVRENIINSLKTNLPDAMVVNEINSLGWVDVEDILEKYYQCHEVEKNVELCWKNKQ